MDKPLDVPLDTSSGTLLDAHSDSYSEKPSDIPSDTPREEAASNLIELVRGYKFRHTSSNGNKEMKRKDVQWTKKTRLARKEA